MNRLFAFALALMGLYSPAEAFRRQRAPSLFIREASSPHRLDDITFCGDKSFRRPSQQHTSLVTSNRLNVRGGGVLGTVLQTAIQNPILVLLLAGTTATNVYKEDIPYAKHLQSFLQLCIAGYIFRMLVTWQRAKQEEMDT